jgi:hypothetical protein
MGDRDLVCGSFISFLLSRFVGDISPALQKTETEHQFDQESLVEPFAGWLGMLAGH